MNSYNKIIIIGAGISGLTAAALLAKENYKVIIFEKDTQIGGRAKVIEKDGFIFDYGLHLIRNGKYGFLPSLLKELGEEIDIIELTPPEVVYYENKKFIPLPSNAQEVLTSDIITENDKNILFSTFQQKDIAEKIMDKSVLEWINEVNGSDKLIKFMTLLSFGIVCPYPERASVGELFLSLRRRIKLGNPPMGVIKGGVYTFYKKLEKIIKDYNGEINTNCEVKEIIVERGKVKGVKVKNKIVEGNTIIYTAPLQHIFDIVDEELVVKEKVNLVKEMHPTSGIVIDYALSKKITEIDKLIVSLEKMPILGLATSNIDSSIAPANKQLISCVALVEAPIDILDKRIAEVILTHVENEIKEMFNKIENYVEFKRVLFLPIINSTELNISQYRERRPPPDYLATEIEGLFLGGDYLCAEGAGGELSITSAKMCVEKVKSRMKHF